MSETLFKPLAPELLCPDGLLSADTSSIIYLSKINLLHGFCTIKQLLISSYVYDELFSLRTIESSAVKILICNDAIRVVKPSVNSSAFKIKLTKADASVIQLYLEYKTQGILTDDGMICSYCRKKSIPYFNTPIALYVLMKNKLITNDRFQTALEDVYQLGRFSQNVKDYMRWLTNDISEGGL